MKWVGGIVALVLALTACAGTDNDDSGTDARLLFFRSLDYEVGSTVTVHAAELGSPQHDALSQELAGADGDVHRALAHQPEQGARGFAFVLIGCAQTGAALVVNNTKITATLTGNEDVMCARPVYFLAIFSVDEASLPPGAHLAD